MRNGIKSKLALCVGLLFTALAAHASFVDASIMIDRAANNKTLIIKYDGARASMVELRINGVSVQSKQVSADFSAGETTFDIDTANLETGNNKVEIRLFDAQGKLLGTQKSDIKIDRSGEGPVFFVSPKPDANSQGVVEIKVGFRQQLKNVYVSFFVNDEFKILKNFPPYSYRWDTMTVPNGWHEVQAWVVDDANATFKTEKLRLFVNNPGGRTKRQNSEEAPITKPATPAKGEVPALTVPMNPTVTSAQGSTTNSKGEATGPKAVDPKGTAGKVNANEPKNVTITNDPKNPEELVAINTNTTKPVEGTVTTPTIAHSGLKPLTINKGRRLADVDSFDIFLDGSKVSFDVAPRVTNGVPLTPFRHLFEGYGGDVKWDNDSKSVTAEAESMNVWFKIGDPNAKVDGHSIIMEMAPFLERGRSIVPLSFMAEALKIDIQFDPNTGHVLIQSAAKKK